MKHIKLYEGFNDDEYYQEIDYEEWFTQRVNRLNISDTLNNRIKDLFDTNYYQKVDGQGSVIYVDKRCRSCEIKISLNDDDWYYVALVVAVATTFVEATDFIRWFVPPFGAYYKIKTIFYKCDQFDGLKNLLKDKGII